MAAPGSRTGSARAYRLGFWRRTRLGLHTSVQFLHAVWVSPYWFLLPFCVVLLLLSVLFVIAACVPAAAPFVYAIF